MMDKKHKMYISSDHYFNDPDMADDMKEMGMDCQPIDITGALVSKKGDSLKDTEENIRQRFNLGGED